MLTRMLGKSSATPVQSTVSSASAGCAPSSGFSCSKSKVVAVTLQVQPKMPQTSALAGAAKKTTQKAMQARTKRIMTSLRTAA
jgi:hypothetical protein